MDFSRGKFLVVGHPRPSFDWPLKIEFDHWSMPRQVLGTWYRLKIEATWGFNCRKEENCWSCPNSQKQHVDLAARKSHTYRSQKCWDGCGQMPWQEPQL